MTSDSVGMERSSKRVVQLFGLLLIGGLGAGALWLLYPGWGEFFPPCLFHEATGLYCTGCGSTRAAHALLSGDLLGAWAQNPLLVLVLPWLVHGAVRGGAAFLGLRWTPPSVDVPGRMYWAFAAIVIVFSVARNLPFVSFLGPLP